MNDNLVKFGDTWFPGDYLEADGWQVTPSQRMELDAYRDANVDLHRVTSPNHKTSAMLTTTPMSQSEKEYVQAIINSAVINEVERKVHIMYWNDETNEYKSGDFYISDVTYTTLGYFGGERWYKSITYQLTEY